MLIAFLFVVSTFLMYLLLSKNFLLHKSFLQLASSVILNKLK